MAKPEFFDTPGYGEIARTRNQYRQAMRIGDRIEISGQGGWEADFTLSATSLAEEIVKACDNVEKTLAEAGASWSDIVNIHSYHVPTADDSVGDDHMRRWWTSFADGSTKVCRYGPRSASRR
jgi:enamine deaminase RidA (YjgF/YER057c/UK114 family)